MARNNDKKRKGRTWDDFAPLYDEHHRRLFRVGVLLCHGRHQQAEDAVAETFIKVYKAWAEGGVENFAAYSRQALVNQVLSQYRKDQVAKRYVQTQTGDLRGERHPDENLADSDEVFALLSQLPPRQRAAVVLRFYEDLPYEQIATTLEVSVGTAKSQVSYGLGRLRELMDQQGNDES